MTDRFMMTGGRNFTNTALIDDALARAVHHGFRTLVHGACPEGADQLASSIWEAWGYPVEPFPANWKVHGLKAGYVRNTEMARSLPGLCIAFLAPCVKRTCRVKKLHVSHGTQHCMKEATRYAIEVWRYTDVPEFKESTCEPLF